MGILHEEPKEYIPENEFKDWMTRGFPQRGDVLFTTEGPLGNVAILNTDEKVAVGQRIITLHCKESIDSIFLANVLMSKDIQDEILRLSTGSTVKGILARYFREIEIPLPSLDIQKAIVFKIIRTSDCRIQPRVDQVVRSEDSADHYVGVGGVRFPQWTYPNSGYSIPTNYRRFRWNQPILFLKKFARRSLAVSRPKTCMPPVYRYGRKPSSSIFWICGKQKKYMSARFR